MVIRFPTKGESESREVGEENLEDVSSVAGSMSSSEITGSLGKSLVGETLPEISEIVIGLEI